MRDIFCNGPKFEIVLKFSTENTLNSRKKKGIYKHWRQKITFYFSGVYDYAQKSDDTVQIGTITGHA